MIRAQELRLGNYVEIDGEFIRVDVITEKGLWFTSKKGTASEFWHNVEPIPLTEEILLKCGFVIYTDGKLSHDSISEFEVNFIFNSKSANIKHLHKLQNLYFALTGEELEVKL